MLDIWVFTQKLQEFGIAGYPGFDTNFVGVSLLAITVGHLAMMWLIDRDREQAHSYRVLWSIGDLWFAANLWQTTGIEGRQWNS
ncbi:hypothetical protein CQ009_16390 [Pseudomonas sp. MYb2]|jgi:hypothetical protein|uniref:hypothetical protein n=1 Tax=unclassified Pseudomonas TaxID=196821 RepID=UPI000D496628|nr:MULTISPECIES: hypothetical protein [unclassified Pseudomonas]PRB48721.1 hypothetical protein CQ025_15055 [Pseudomonas sp. MYb3]PRC32851.1 hypothetical protein CQ009_16390 [Pseudomonas sp. MYb2]